MHEINFSPLSFLKETSPWYMCVCVCVSLLTFLVCVSPFQLLNQLPDFHETYGYYAVRGHPNAIEVEVKLVPLILQS
jgi:hypothetical protein